MKVRLNGHPMGAYNYFYLNGKLYKVLQAIRTSDYLSAWNYVDHGVEEFIYSDIKKKAEPAFSTDNAAKLVGRSRETVYNAYLTERGVMGGIKTYPLDGKNTPAWYSRRYWSKKDVYNLYDYFASKRGSHAKEGNVPRARNNLMSKKELRAALEHEVSYFVQNKDGEFVKVFSAEDL